MKYTTILSIIATVVIIQISCKKEDNNSTGILVETQSRMEFEFPSSGILVDMVDDGKTLSLLMEDEGQSKIIKLGMNGEVLWEKVYGNIDGRPLHLIQLENGDMAFATSSVMLSKSNTSFFGWFQQSIDCNSQPTEQTAYQLMTDSLTEYSNSAGANNLVKVDSNGNVKWNISMNHGSAEFRMSYSNSKISLVVNYAPITSSYVLDRRFGGQYPVITYDLYDGRMLVEEYNASSGALFNKFELNKQLIEGFKSPSFQQLSSPYPNPYYFGSLLGLNNDCISYSQGLVQIENGIAKQIDGPYKVCENKLENHNIQSAGRDVNGVVFIAGNYYNQGEKVSYLSAINEDGSIGWVKEVESKEGYMKIVTYPEQNGFYLRRNASIVEHYNDAGVLQSSHQELPSMDGEITLIRAHPKGVTFLTYSNTQDKIVRLYLNKSGI